VNIIVCLKQVPDTESQIKIGPDGKSIVTDDIKWVMNPYDEFGVEEALRLKEKHGGRGVDDDLGLVGATIAELLSIPQFSIIVKVEVAEDGKSVKVERPIEGEALIIESNLPALITAQKGLNEPRYASLPGIMKAKKKPLEEKTLADLGLDSAEFGEGARKLKILELTPPPERAAGKIVEGETPQEKAAELAKLLHDEAKVL